MSNQKFLRVYYSYQDLDSHFLRNYILGVATYFLKTIFPETIFPQYYISSKLYFLKTISPHVHISMALKIFAYIRSSRELEIIKN